jgi:hypothetical protein
MKQDAIVMGVVLLALACAALLVIWLQEDDLPDRRVVEALAGPQGASAPPGKATPKHER